MNKRLILEYLGRTKEGAYVVSMRDNPLYRPPDPNTFVCSCGHTIKVRRTTKAGTDKTPKGD